MKQIIQYILATILAFAIMILVLINILSSTILSDTYILSKMEEDNYYSQIYEYALNKFKNYIPQSGLEEEVLDGVLTENKIKNDTNIVINNIYSGMDAEIETDEIAEKLNENIQQYLGDTITSEQQSAIDTFVNTICTEYEDAITHTTYESKINTYYTKILEYTKIGKKIALVIIGVSVLLIALLTIKRIYRMISKIGVAFVIDGLIFITSNIYVYKNVKINTITVFNDAISEVLRDILNDILLKIMIYGSALLVLGIIFIIIYAIIKSVRKYKRQKEQYTPEV